MLSTLLSVLLVIDAIVLILLIVALQHGNEGGLGGAFGSESSSGFFGASGGATFIVRATWIAGVVFFILTGSLAWVKTRAHFGVGRELDALGATTAPSATAAPTPVATAAVTSEAPERDAAAPESLPVEDQPLDQPTTP